MNPMTSSSRAASELRCVRSEVSHRQDANTQVAFGADGSEARGNRPLSSPIYRATTWSAIDVEQHAALLKEGRETFYQRFGSVNEARLEALIADLEGGEEAAVFASGMAAVSTALLALLSPGSHLVAGRAIFEQTERVMRGLLAERGVSVAFVDTRDQAAVARAVRPETRLIYVESPSNPGLHVADIAALAGIATAAGARLVVDSTFASPVLSRPLSFGAGIVLHSLTKLINGHSDAMGGAVVGDAASIRTIREWKRLLGGVLDADACWLIERGIRTLPLRARRTSASALAIARFLLRQPAVAEVRYPWLPEHESYEVAKRQMSGGGPVICLRLREGREAAHRLLNGLRLIRLATSLGGVETVIELPYELDWAAESAPLGPRDLIRLSVGLEAVADLRADLEQALERLDPDQPRRNQMTDKPIAPSSALSELAVRGNESQPPLAKRTVVAGDPTTVFDLFTQRLGDWWPLSLGFSTLRGAASHCAMDPRLGGELFEQSSEAKRAIWGRVIAWEPARRLVASWFPGREEDSAQTVELRFTPRPGEATLVELEQRDWGRLEPAAAAEAWESYDVGWETVLCAFGAFAARQLGRPEIRPTASQDEWGVRCRVVIARRPEEVFDALATAEGLDRWFTDGAELQREPQGRMVLRWDLGDGNRLEIPGRVVRYRPPKRFSFDWLADSRTFSSSCDIALVTSPDGTIVQLTEHGYPRSETGLQDLLNRQGGWGQQLTRLKVFLEHGIRP